MEKSLEVGLGGKWKKRPVGLFRPPQAENKHMFNRVDGPGGNGRGTRYEQTNGRSVWSHSAENLRGQETYIDSGGRKYYLSNHKTEKKVSAAGLPAPPSTKL